MNEVQEVLADRNELSDNERCYQYLMDKIAMNPARFDSHVESMEKWGTIENGYAVFYPAAFNSLCRDGGFSKTAFLSWAERKKLIQTQAGRKDKVKKVYGRSLRCVYLKLNDEEPGGNEFRTLEKYEQGELPFR